MGIFLHQIAIKLSKTTKINISILLFIFFMCYLDNYNLTTTYICSLIFNR